MSNDDVLELGIQDEVRPVLPATPNRSLTGYAMSMGAAGLLALGFVSLLPGETRANAVAAGTPVAAGAPAAAPVMSAAQRDRMQRADCLRQDELRAAMIAAGAVETSGGMLIDQCGIFRMQATVESIRLEAAQHPDLYRPFRRNEPAPKLADSTGETREP